MKLNRILSLFALLLVCGSCSWFGADEVNPYEGMTREEEFAARNEKALSRDVNVNRDQYMKNMQISQDANKDLGKEKPRDFARVKSLMGHAEYNRIRSQAELGDEESCYQMGIINKYGYYTGKANLAAARRWFENAAELGSIKARHQLKYMGRAGRPRY